MKQILITGGLGFLGGRLFEQLKDSGYDIWIGSRRKVNSEVVIAAYQGAAGFVETNWQSQESLAAICKNMDIIIHLAAMDAVEAEANPAGALEMNGVATVRLMEAAISQHVSKFVYLSTSHVYGSALSGIVTEENCPLPVHPYATSHKAAEDVVAAAVKRNRIQGVIIRLSNSFGAPVLPEANCWDLLIPGLSRQAITMGRMVLKSSGLQKRDFISITDATRAIVHLTFFDQLTAPESIVFNVGGNFVCTVCEMAERIRYRCKQLFGKEVIIDRPLPSSSNIESDLLYQTSRLQETGFQWQCSIDEEIDKLLLYCKLHFYAKE